MQLNFTLILPALSFLSSSVFAGSGESNETDLATRASVNDTISLDDTVNDWSSILSGDSTTCPDVGVIFAPGTFDDGNTGVWVGPFFNYGLEQNFTKNGISYLFQGVGSPEYTRSLTDYLFLGGSCTCAEYIATSIQTFYKACPSTKFVISGWSQGALCAHKSLNNFTDTAALDQVFALVTFGDPLVVFSDTFQFPSIPSSITYMPYCMNQAEDGMEDPLCQGASSDAWGALVEVEAVLDGLGTAIAKQETLYDEQKQAVEELTDGLVGNITSSTIAAKMVVDFWAGHLNRWFLSVPHFLYGNNGNAQQAASDVFNLYQSL